MSTACRIWERISLEMTAEEKKSLNRSASCFHFPEADCAADSLFLTSLLKSASWDLSIFCCISFFIDWSSAFILDVFSPISRSDTVFCKCFTLFFNSAFVLLFTLIFVPTLTFMLSSSFNCFFNSLEASVFESFASTLTYIVLFNDFKSLLMELFDSCLFSFAIMSTVRLLIFMFPPLKICIQKDGSS